MKYAYINGIILDGTENMAPQTGKMILTDGERIAAVTEQSEEKMQGYQPIDLQGKYIMPGLINLHIHLPAGGKPKKKPVDNTKLVRIMTSNGLTRWILRKMCISNAQMQLFSGVTTVRTVGGVLDVDSKVRDGIRSGKWAGPRILAADMAISVPGGHMAGSLAYAAKSEEEVCADIKKIVAGKPDLIKLMITGGVLDAKKKGEPGELKMSPALVKTACREAHALGLPVAAHVESPEGVKVALENGVDTIEHGAEPNEEILSLFKEKNAKLVTTLSPALPYALFDREISHASEMEQFNGNVVFEGIQSCAKACLKEGIPVGLGTDTGCPYITHYDMWRELYYFHKYCGVSNSFALYTATKRNAEIVGLEESVGTIAEGKYADFVVTEKNPLEDLRALRSISMVTASGKPYRKPKVKKSAQIERELNKFCEE